MDQARIKNIPEGVYYFPNFISPEEEQEILCKVYSVPKPKWTYLSHRRLQNWGGVPHNNGMIAEPIPTWLQNYMTKTAQYFPNGITPNHALINEYLPGQGILPHTDGPIFYPLICTISCGSQTILHFSKVKENSIAYSVLLERRSLVVITGEMYHSYKHSIAEKPEDVLDETVVNIRTPLKEGDVLNRKTRVSLTIRHVPSTSKFKLKLSR